MATVEATRLSAEELIDLERILDTVNRDSAMTLEELDGYCTALVMAQALSLNADHLLDIFDLPENELEKQLVPSNRQRFTRLIDQQLGQILGRLNQGDLSPLIRQANNPSDHVPGSDWAAGFVRGMDTEEDAYAILDEDEDVWDWIDPVYDMLEDPPKPGREAEERVETMIEGLIQLHAWLQVRGA